MKISTLTRGLCSGLFLVLCASGTLCAQNQVIITPSPGNLDGNSWARPFHTAESGRFQQVYSASLFSSLPPGGGSIFSIEFRIDPFLGQSFIDGIRNLQVNISTTSRSVDGLSAVFDENTGTNDRLVLGPGPIGISGIGGGGLTGYHVDFPLTQPFLYDPAAGNLLVDFRVHRSGEGTTPGRVAILDAFDVLGDGVSSVFAYGNSLPAVGQVSSLGLATAFSITPVPEPSTWVMVAAGIVVLVVFRKLKKHKEGKNAAH